MKLKDQALLKVKIDKMHQMYLEAAIKNPKLRDMANDFGDISVGMNNLCAAYNLMHQAALERDDKWYLIWLENEDLKKQIEILKEGIDKAVKDWSGEMRDYEKEWED